MKGKQSVFLNFLAIYFHYICYLWTKSCMQLEYVHKYCVPSLTHKTDVGSWQLLLCITVGYEGDIKDIMLQVYACVYV